MTRYDDRPANYVPAYVDEDPRTAIVPGRATHHGDLGEWRTPPLPAAVQTTATLRGDYTDRAKGFQLVTVPLAVGVGLGSLLVGIVGWGVPVLSVAALGWLWSGFLLTWLAAWAIHTVASPDGIALIHAVLGYRLIRHEQRERWARWRPERGK